MLWLRPINTGARQPEQPALLPHRELPAGRDRASLCGPPRSSAGPPRQKIPLHNQLADLGVQLLDLLRWLPVAGPGSEDPFGMLQQLLLPGVNLRRTTW